MTIKSPQKTINQIRLYRGARFSFLLATIFTAFNVLMIVLDQNFYFIFSATLPQVITYLGYLISETFYEPIIYPISIFISVLIILTFVLIFILSKKYAGAMIAALVLFSIDSALILYSTISMFDASLILDILFHAFLIYELVVGIKVGYALKKHPLGINVTEKQILEEEQKLIEQERLQLQQNSDEETEPITYLIPDSIPLFNYYGKGKIKISATHEKTAILLVESGMDLQLVIDGKIYQVISGFSTAKNFTLTANYHGVKYSITQRNKFIVGHLTLYANDTVLSTGRRLL